MLASILRMRRLNAEGQHKHFEGISGTSAKILQNFFNDVHHKNSSRTTLGIKESSVCHCK